MFYSSKHSQATTASPTRRRIAGVAVAGATAAVGTIATAGNASANGVWDSVAQCESGGNWSISTGNGFYGGLQFTTQTWNGFGGGKYASNANQATKAQQIEIAQKVLQTQGPGAWPTCSKVAGLTKANGMGGGSSAPAPTQEAAPAPAPTQEAAPAPKPESTPAPQQSAPAQGSSDNMASRSEARTGSLAVDGIRGPKTNAAIEKWVGTSADSVLNTGDVKALQAKVGTVQDGIIGPKTTAAVQATVGAAQDGIWGPVTTTQLQKHLNAQGL